MSDALLEAARALAPDIAAARGRMEEERRLTPGIIDGLANSGLFRMLVPSSLGGAEAPMSLFAEVIEEVARADGSVGFCLGHAAGASTVAAVLDEEVGREVFNGPGSNMANGPGFGGRAVRVEGGFRISGRWAFASGCHHATWLGGGCTVTHETGSQRDGGPEQYFMVFPAADAELVDIWNVVGLRGTGSDLVSVNDLFVPQDRAVPEPRRRAGERRPLYLFGYPATYSIAFAAVGLGIARGALDAFVELAGSKVARGHTAALRENAVVQSQMAQAEAHLRSARAFLYEAIGDAWEAACREGEIPMRQRIAVRLATTYVIRRSAQVVDIPYHLAGGTSVFTGDPLEQRFRDIHALTQQAQGREDHYETVGQFLLGLEPEGTRL